MSIQIKRPARGAFTLIELLVVVAIIALLISILLPSLSRARQQARLVTCSANLHDIGITLTSYYNDHDWHFPAQNLLGPTNLEREQRLAAGMWGLTVHEILAQSMGGLQYSEEAILKQAQGGETAELTQTHKVFYCPFVKLSDMDNVDELHGPDTGNGSTNAEEKYLHIGYVYTANLHDLANDPAENVAMPPGVDDALRSDILKKRKEYVAREGSADDALMLDHVMQWTGGGKWRINHGIGWQAPLSSYPPKLDSANILYGDGHVETKKQDHFKELFLGPTASAAKRGATLDCTGGGVYVWW